MAEAGPGRSSSRRAISNPTVNTVESGASPDVQLSTFLSKFSPEVEAMTRECLTKLRIQFPNAIQMVYDNYNRLVIGFSPSERPSEAILSLAAYARGVSLCFLQRGPDLYDPAKLLRGAGNVARHIRLESAEDIDSPDVQDLILQALALASKPMELSYSGRLIIKSVSAKQRPRRA